jgi:hypothetical protein
MAVAAPARRTAPAPAPSRTTPPPKRRTAPARPAPRKKAAPARAPRTRPKPRSAAAPARKAPARRAPARMPRRVGGQLIPLAGRTAVAVGQLPDSGLVVRMTRGRAWIVVLGVLLAGIVALNVLTLSFSASASQVDQQAVVLDRENSILSTKDARLFGTGAMRNAAGALGLAMPASDQIHFTDAGADDVAVAVQRLAAAGG